jgi:EF-P beta-lysylation protein EpmB
MSTTTTPSPKLDWQQELIQAVTDPRELCRLLELNPETQISGKALANFPLKVPRSFIARMEKGNPADPLLLQVLPLPLEDEDSPAYSEDPLREEKVNPVSGLLHKYHGRVLLTLTGVCAINCRFCFRRHFPYAENNPSQQGWEKAFTYIKNDTTIQEVILSGGDPLLLNDRLLKTFTDQLSTISHVKRLRIHSRVPIVLPERITEEFVAWLSGLPLKAILVTHCNHPQEISPTVSLAMQTLKQAGVLLLNQAVLLKGINDQVETLVALSEALFAAGIQPYYLHLLDKVQGAAHFDSDLSEAKKLYRELSHRLPGYLLPKLAQENPGEGAKTLILPA